MPTSIPASGADATSRHDTLTITSSSSIADEASTAQGKPTRLYAIALFVGIVGNALALFTPISLGLSLKINALVDATDRVGSLSLVMGVGALFALIANPLFGRLSDRTTSRWGRRKPWIIGGALIGFSGLIMIAISPTVTIVLVGWCIVQMGFNAVIAATNATLADQVPRQYRGKMSGVIGMGVPVGMALGAGVSTLFKDLTWMIITPALLGTCCALFFALVLKDKPTASMPGRFTWLEFFGAFAFDPRKHPDFAWVCITKFLFMCAYASGTGYIAYFLLSVLDVPASEVPSTIFFTLSAVMGGALLTSPLGGWLSDRYGMRKPFVMISAVVAMTGLFLTGSADSIPMLVVGQLVLGLGVGCFNAVDFALATDTLPNDANKAKNLGVFNICATLPQTLVPLAAAPVISNFGFGGLFFGAGCLGLLGALLVLRVKSVR